ncbi:MAG: chromosomal replication initiator protein DnaA [Oscillospiraceae bacterium]|nr:chromosomal replication initiator protein DnaA [Oscillospiraceae bacterium]MDD5920670.1 chromosomal replication initiator protein DnaA [Oscillospiraceae bacterium]
MESLQDILDLVFQKLQETMNPTAFKVWIKCLEPVRMEDSTVYLQVQTQFMRDQISQKYTSLLENTFEEVIGFPVHVVIDYKFKDENVPIRKSVPEPLNRRYSPEEIAKTSAGGDYEYTFSTFIVGPSNKFAHAASLAVATNPAGAYNPLFIYGGSGLGKTHLLYAISNEITKNNPNANAIYIKGEDFTNELIEAIKSETTIAFHNKYRQADILLVDDIQFIGGKDQTQEEFFHTFNTLYQAEKQIVLTSDRPPKEIKTLEDRLRTRFEWGLLADIQPPDFETRIAIIQRKAELLDIHVPDEVCEYIANKLKTNIRQLEGVVKKLKAYKLLAGTPPSVLIAQNAIREVLNDQQPVPVTVERIIAEVGRTCGVSPQDIRSNKRSATISSARQVSIYIVREITQMSMAAIGEEFGGRDHSTIVYAIQQVEKNMKADFRYREMVEDIVKNIQNT